MTSGVNFDPINLLNCISIITYVIDISTAIIVLSLSYTLFINLYLTYSLDNIATPNIQIFIIKLEKILYYIQQKEPL